MSSVELLFTLLKLALLLRHLLLEDHLHLALHLGQLLFMEGALFLLLDRRVDLLEDAGILLNTHLRQLVGSVILVQRVVRVLLELLHVRADEHLPQLDKVAVLLVVNLDDTPGVAASAHFATFRAGDLGICTHNCEGDFGHNFLVFRNRLLIVQFITRAFEDLDPVVVDVRENLWTISR